jgi:hypothetical protein
MSHLHEVPADPVLHLLDEMTMKLEDDRRRLRILAEEARQVAGRARLLPSAVGFAAETLEQLDTYAEELDAKQQSVLRLVDHTVDRAKRSSQPITDDAERWAAPWEAPDRQYREEDVAAIPASPPELTEVARRRQQLARVLVMVGVLLILSGLLTVVL